MTVALGNWTMCAIKKWPHFLGHHV